MPISPSPHLRYDAPNESREIMWFQPQCEVTGLNSRHVNEHIGERLKPFRSAPNLLDSLILPLRQRWAFATVGLYHKSVNVATERGDGGTQRMGGALKELLPHLFHFTAPADVSDRRYDA
jgi:hypothetical protein